MSGTILTIAAGLFGFPLAIMLAFAILGGEVPPTMLWLGGWFMAFGVILGGIGAFFAAGGG
jgi:hypothetical protein